MSKLKSTVIARRFHRLGAPAAVLLLAAGPALAQAPPPTPVRTDPVRTDMLRELRQVTGNLRSVARSRVATKEAGVVVSLPIEAGQSVEAGDVLAELDSAILQLQIDQVLAEQTSAEATLDERTADAQRELRDWEALKAVAARGASNVKELDDAENEWKAADARRVWAQREIEVIKARAALLRKRLEDTVIRAPFDGVVIARFTERGEWVGQGDPIAEVLSIESYDAWLEVPQRYAGALIGRESQIRVRLDATDEVIEVSTPRVIPQVDPAARTFAVVVRIPNARGVLAPGMSVTGWVPIGDRTEHVTVHKDAVLQDRSGAHVYVIRTPPDGPALAMPAPIRVLFELAERVAVSSEALAPGDQVVIEGNERLFPGTPVAIVNASQGAGGAGPGPAGPAGSGAGEGG